jgi:hypothetical protein
LTDSAAYETRLKRWRLILGQASEEKLAGMGGGNGATLLNSEESVMDRALAALYDGSRNVKTDNKRSAGLGASYPHVAKWLIDIRSSFPQDVVSIMQADAIEYKGLKQLIMEPEVLSNVKPDTTIVETIMILKDEIPAKSKEQARILVKTLVDEIMRRLEYEVRQAVTGAIHKKQYSPIPNLPNIDWKKTIRKNLKNYDFSGKRIIPEKFYFFANKKKRKEWNVIIDMDQSGSMADSIIYASILGSIFASIPALDTRIVAFDAEVVDLTEKCGNDPVDILFGVQLGGGTDINKSVKYCAQFVENPKKTLFILISDLYEGGVAAGLLRQLSELKESGVTVLVLLALSDSGVPSYDESLARKIAGLGVPSFGCTPAKLPELVGGALRGDDLTALAERVRIK